MGKIKEIFNYNNIGQKIKSLTKWSCWITILLIWIAAPIAFIALVSDEWTAYFCWIPILAAIVGPVVVWVGSWAIYAFGEMVQGISNIDDNTFSGDKKSAVQRDSEKKKIEKLEQLRAKGLITEEEYKKTLEQIR